MVGKQILQPKVRKYIEENEFYLAKATEPSTVDWRLKV